MKKLLIAAALTIASATFAQADPVYGVWKTQVDDGKYAHITLSQCGSKICGVVSRAFEGSSEIKTVNMGKKLVWDMAPSGGGKYGGGKIWQPSTGKVYNSKMTLSGSTLQVAGCVGPICKKQTWSRIK